MNGLYAAPVEAPRDILDVGTGTGRWAVEMAQRFPHANVFAVDLRTPPADEGAAALAHPDNYIFAEGDVTKGLNFPAMSFDFVHQRLLVAALRAEDWPKAVAELVRLTRRGGWIELVEGDFSRGGGRGLS